MRIRGHICTLCGNWRDARFYGNDTLTVFAAQRVVDRLLDEESARLADLDPEGFIGKTISLRAQTSYSQEHFDIILLQT